MTDDETAILAEVRDAIGRLNRALGKAQSAGLTADLTVGEQHFVGSAAPLISIAGRLKRARVELDERL